MLASLVRYELCAFMVATVAIILWLMMTGRITVRGLLTTGADGADSPARMQMLLATFVAVTWYAALVVGTDDPTHMPDVPTGLLALIGGSHATYLGAKAGDQLGWLRSLLGTKTP